ncbi:MAG: chloride channel protein, partial [Pseudomonadota bacterium]
MKSFIPKKLPSIVAGWIRPNWVSFIESASPHMWVLSVIIGVSVGVAAIIFREAIGFFQLFWLSSSDENTLTSALNVAWYWILLAPVVGGLIVGQLLQRLNARRAGGVADVIEARTNH